MKYLKQFGIILAISFIGELLNHLIPLPVPASIYGLILMFLVLETGILPLSSVRESSYFLIEIMPVMFIPAAVGLMDSWSSIRSSILPYLITTIVSTVAVMAISGLITQLVIHIRKSNKGAE